jgi:serine/threonine-protein kinase
MSPEQLQSQALDGRADLYSVGIIMFEAFTGAHPFASEKLSHVIRHQVMTPAPDPRETNPEVPESLAAIILGCLAKEPDGRPATAVSLYASLLNVTAAAPAA